MLIACVDSVPVYVGDNQDEAIAKAQAFVKQHFGRKNLLREDFWTSQSGLVMQIESQLENWLPERAVLLHMVSFEYRSNDYWLNPHPHLGWVCIFRVQD